MGVGHVELGGASSGGREPRLLPVPVRLTLGEGPTWDPRRGSTYVVDIDTGALWEVSAIPTPIAIEVLRCGTTLGAIALAADGGFLLAAGGGLRHVDATGQLVREFPLVPATVKSRLNDGAVDPAGRFVVGSLANDHRKNGERLWRLESDGQVTILDDDLALSNGLGWSPDGCTLYNIDSGSGIVWARDYEPESGRTGARRPLLEIVDGTPDGMAVDAEGNLWVAIWGAGQVRAYQPNGTLLAIISVGPPLTTSCAFTGPELRTLLITTAGKHVDGVAPHPDAGALFEVDLPVTGQPQRMWDPVG